MFRRDRLFAVLLFIACIVCFLFTKDFPKQAAYYPRAVLIIMAGLCIPLFINAKEEDVIDMKAFVKDFFVNRKFLYVLIALVSMVVFMKPIGLYIELPIFVFAVLHICGYKSIKKSIIIAFSVTVIIYVLFSLLLHVRIPMGLLKGIL